MKNISRKEFLKLGTALPLALQSLELRAAVKPQVVKSPPKRIIFVCSCLGFYEPYFFPKKRGDFSTSDYLRDFKTLDKMTVFQNLYHPGMDTSNHDSEKSFLTGSPSPESSTFVNGISLDQVMAKEMGGDTRFPFLNFSIYDRGWGISWNDRGSPIPPMHDEEKIFEKLFEKENLAAKKRQLRNDQNILNSLRRDLELLRNKGTQSAKLDSYKVVIRELEQQLEHEKFWLNTEKPKVEKSLSDDQEYVFSTKIHNLFELAKLAFQTDSTRVITISMDWIDGAIKVPGAVGGWHTLSHHGGKPGMIESLSKIEIDTLKHFNRFLFEMDQFKEGEGTLLDNTTVVMGSNFGDASNHTCNNLPMIVAGGGYRHKSHTVLEQPTHLCNLYLELLHKHNIDAGEFGNSVADLGLTEELMPRLYYLAGWSTFLWGVFFSASFVQSNASTDEPPNIILFLVDDMGLMDTSAPMLADENGKPKRYPLNDWYRTPNMERLAAQGVRFSNFYSHNVCSPTRVSMMNGQNSARHRCTDYIFPWKNNREIDNRSFPLATTQQVPPEWNWVGLKESDVSLPNLFRKAGYQTIHVGKAHFAPKDREGENPLNLGFDVNVAGTCFGAPGSYYGTRSFGVGSKNLHARPVPHLEKYHGQNIFLTEALTLEAKAEIDKALNASKPFLLHMSHYAVHSPFQSDPRFAKNYQGKSPSLMAYATMIEGMDKSLGDLMDHIETKGVAENTLIIFLGDNGGDAPDKDLDGISSCAPLRGRKGAKWEGGMRVPFIASWGKVNPGNAFQKDNPIVPNSMLQEFGTCFDLLPTLCMVAQIKIPKSHNMDGQELGDLFAGKSNSDHRDVFLNHYPHPRRGKSQFFSTWRNGDWKVIYEYLNSGPKRYSLFNLKNDISESNNLAEKHPDKLRKMMTEMVDELTKMKALYPVKESKVLKPVIPGA